VRRLGDIPSPIKRIIANGFLAELFNRSAVPIAKKSSKQQRARSRLRNFVIMGS
jgi:hypothetical protein